MTPSPEQSSLVERLILATGDLIRATDGMEAIRPQRQAALEAMSKVADTIIERLSQPPDGVTEELADRIANAEYAVGKARLQLARLLDHAAVHGLSDQSELAQDTFASIRRLDEAFPRSTDQGTGLPLAQKEGAALRSAATSSDRSE